MPVVEPIVNEEKLRQLLAEQSESETLDYKESLDLMVKRDEVELAKDLGAMLFLGGYIVIGADSRGHLTGQFTAPQAAQIDEARLRKMMAKYLPEPFDLLTASHYIDGNLVGVIYVGPHRDCLAVFKASGQYQNDRGKSVVVFRQGDVFARHGSSSEPWRQEDVERFRRCIAEREKERWRRELSADIERMGIGRSAQRLTSGPASNFTWRLDAATFQAALIELMRRRDRIPVQLLVQRAPADAASVLREGDRSELSTLLDRLACMASLGISLERSWLTTAGIDALRGIYQLGFQDREQANALRREELWLLVIERAYAVGALAVRQSKWSIVRTIALTDAEPEELRYHRSWIRHAVTMAARSGLFRGEREGRAIELSLLSLALEVARSQECLHPNSDPESESLLDSLCQFDILASLAAIAESGSLDTRYFYTSFARFYSHRTEPAVRRLLRDHKMRESIFPRSDAELARALREISRLATHEAFAYAGWDGYTDETVRRFIEQHHPRE